MVAATPPTAPAVIVCTPSYAGTLPVEHVTALLETMAKLPAAGVRVRWLPRCGDALLSMARNWLAAEALADQVALILDGGPSPIGQASTVLDVTVEPPRVLRRGHLVDDPFLAARVNG